jgi:hypothetical protein
MGFVGKLWPRITVSLRVVHEQAGTEPSTWGMELKLGDQQEVPRQLCTVAFGILQVSRPRVR